MLTPIDPYVGQAYDDRETDRTTLLEWLPIFIVNNYSKFEVNILSKDRNIRKRLILSEDS